MEEKSNEIYEIDDIIDSIDKLSLKTDKLSLKTDKLSLSTQHLKDIKYIIIIQKFIKKYILKNNVKIKSIIEVLNNNSLVMDICLYELHLISIKYVPQKNENKFIYGKLIEKSLINALTKVGYNVNDLDKNHSIGSEYRNDIKLLDINFSIKGKLNKKGNIILINKKSTNLHDIEMYVLLCIINEEKLYFIPYNIIDKIETYITSDSGTISYKGKLITYVDKNYPNYIYKFNKLSNTQYNDLKNHSEIDIMTKLYDETIKI